MDEGEMEELRGGGGAVNATLEEAQEAAKREIPGFRKVIGDGLCLLHACGAAIAAAAGALPSEHSTALLKEEIRLELRSWEVGASCSQMRKAFGALEPELKAEVQEEMRRLASGQSSESSYLGDVSLATIVVLKGFPFEVMACDLDSGEIGLRAEAGGLTQKANGMCVEQKPLQLIW